MLTPTTFRRGLDYLEKGFGHVASALAAATKYGGYTLKRGDNDERRVWGGVKVPAEAGVEQPKDFVGPVAQLQTDLAALGVYTMTVDGDFGGGTEIAVKRFQWNAKNVPNRIMTGKSTPVPVAHRSFGDAADGVATPATAREIKVWQDGGYTATGDLVRLDVSSLKNMKNGTKKIANSSIQASEIVVSRDLIADIKAMDAKAGELGIVVHLNQTLRVVGVPVKGAVVTPAKKSQHLVGHAVDCNLIDGDSWNGSKVFKAGNETENAKKFVKAMTDGGMRWGGNWEKVDTPHFDRQVSAGTDDYDHKYFFNQRTIAAKQPITKGML